jgi:hypothetical protein
MLIFECVSGGPGGDNARCLRHGKGISLHVTSKTSCHKVGGMVLMWKTSPSRVSCQRGVLVRVEEGVCTPRCPRCSEMGVVR